MPPEVVPNPPLVLSSSAFRPEEPYPEVPVVADESKALLPPVLASVSSPYDGFLRPSLDKKELLPSSSPRAPKEDEDLVPEP